MSKTNDSFSCHRYDIDTSRKPISQVPIPYDTHNIDIGDISQYVRYIDPSVL